MNLIDNKYTQGEAYQIAQEITNIRKLFGVHFFPLSAIYISALLVRLGALNNPFPIAGFTHGSRNAVETILFQYLLQKLVLGTDISSSAYYFPQLIRHDMNRPLSKDYGAGSLGFVFSNSWDHSNNPRSMFHNWISSLDPSNGYLIVEKQASSGAKSTISDPFAANDEELIQFISDISNQDSLSCQYAGTLVLRWVPSSIIRDCNHPLTAGTATMLHELAPGKMYLTGFSSKDTPRHLNHHVFVRANSEVTIRRSKSIIASFNRCLDTEDPILLECLLRIHPVTLEKIDFRNDIIPKIVSQVLLSSELKSKVFLDKRGDNPGEGDNLASEVDAILLQH